MGRRIPFGEPQNQSERWAFDFLEQRLPDDIEFLTNIEVLSETGQPFEVDAIVLGPWAIHFIDVKGYSGKVFAGKDVWELALTGVAEKYRTKVRLTAIFLADWERWR